jgi:hypothetical protein
MQALPPGSVAGATLCVASEAGPDQPATDVHLCFLSLQVTLLGILGKGAGGIVYRGESAT